MQASKFELVVNAETARMVGVLVQRSMGPRLIIVGSIGAHDPAQMRFTEHNDVVQAPVCTEN